MMRKSPATLFCWSVFIFIIPPLHAEGHFQDFLSMGEPFRAYSLEKGTRFHCESSFPILIFELDRSEYLFYAGFEHGSEVIDSEAEAVTSLFMSGTSIANEEGKKILNEVLPATKAGAMRLTSYWLRNRAERISFNMRFGMENRAFCEKFIERIRNKFYLDKSDVDQNYMLLIRRLVGARAAEFAGILPEKIRANFVERLIEYYRQPDKKSHTELWKFMRFLYSKRPHREYDAAEKVLKELGLQYEMMDGYGEGGLSHEELKKAGITERR